MLQYAMLLIPLLKSMKSWTHGIMLLIGKDSEAYTEWQRESVI